MKPGVTVAPSASIITSLLSIFLKLTLPISSINPSLMKIQSPSEIGFK